MVQEEKGNLRWFKHCCVVEQGTCGQSGQFVAARACVVVDLEHEVGHVYARPLRAQQGDLHHQVEPDGHRHQQPERAALPRQVTTHRRHGYCLWVTPGTGQVQTSKSDRGRVEGRASVLPPCLLVHSGSFTLLFTVDAGCLQQLEGCPLWLRGCYVNTKHLT